jgi:hypothetical protein
VLFFFAIAYVSLFRARDTIELLPVARRPIYARRYFWTGLALIVSPLVAVVLSFTMDPESRAFVFFAETLAVWTFSAYWIIKTKEMRESNAEKLALDGELNARSYLRRQPTKRARGHPPQNRWTASFRRTDPHRVL